MTSPSTPPPSSSAAHFPPGPSGLPALGSIIQFGSRQVLTRYLDMQQAYGDLVHMKIGAMHMFILFDPEDVQYVLIKNQKNYEKGMGYNGLRLLLGQGLVTSDGEVWRQDRKLMQPHFTPTAITRFSEMMIEVTQRMLDRWQVIADQGDDLAMDEEMMRLTMSIIGRAMFSLDLGEELDQIGQAFREAFDFIPSRTGASLIPLSFPLPRHRRFQKNMQEIEDFLQKRITIGRANVDQNDILSILLRAQDAESGYQLSETQLRDEVVTLFFAGFETTARSLAWGWYLLSQHPEAMRALVEEAGQVFAGREPQPADLGKLRYSRMVVDETLRIYPPTAMLARQAVTADEIHGYTIPAGSMIVLVPYMVHRCPEVWPNPEMFDPQRHGENASYPKNAYIPFASGPRVCLGNSFALQEMVLAFSMAAARFDLERVDTSPILPEFAGTIRPDRSLRMRIKPRGG